MEKKKNIPSNQLRTRLQNLHRELLLSRIFIHLESLHEIREDLVVYPAFLARVAIVFIDVSTWEFICIVRLPRVPTPVFEAYPCPWVRADGEEEVVHQVGWDVIFLSILRLGPFI